MTKTLKVVCVLGAISTLALTGCGRFATSGAFSGKDASFQYEDGKGTQLQNVDMPADEYAGVDTYAIEESSITDDLITEQEAEAEPIPEKMLTIHFGFDSFTLSTEAQETLLGNAVYLKAHPDVKISIEGHCDDRGSDEYNLALGQRRVVSVQQFLTALGIEKDRMIGVSYGEELPAVQGTSEEARTQNRRAEFKERN